MTNLDLLTKVLDGAARDHNFTVEHYTEHRFKCETCGNTWSPDLLPGGWFPRGWWKCPRGCNATQTR
jgi:hypothetical protein